MPGSAGLVELHASAKSLSLNFSIVQDSWKILDLDSRCLSHNFRLGLNRTGILCEE